MVELYPLILRSVAALAIGFSAIELIDRLLEPTDLRIQEAADEFRKLLEDEYISSIRKDFQAEIEKKPDDCLDNASDIKKLIE